MNKSRREGKGLSSSLLPRFPAEKAVCQRMKVSFPPSFSLGWSGRGDKMKLPDDFFRRREPRVSGDLNFRHYRDLHRRPGGPGPGVRPVHGREGWAEGHPYSDLERLLSFRRKYRTSTSFALTVVGILRQGGSVLSTSTLVGRQI